MFNVADWFGLHNLYWQTKLSISARDLILLLGGLFLLYKGNKEIYDSVEGANKRRAAEHRGLLATVVQIGLLGIVLGLDSVITAVGMTDYLGVMHQLQRDISIFLWCFQFLSYS